MIDSFKYFQDTAEGGPSFRALFPAHLHKVHIWCWRTVRRDLGPAVGFNPLPYIEEYFYNGENLKFLLMRNKKYKDFCTSKTIV